MSKIMYSTTHEWVRADGKVCKVGISEFAQKELGDIVFISLPEVGASVVAGSPLCDVESVKAVSEINSPVSGTVVAVNEQLEASPELINQDALSAWICEVEFDSMPTLMTEEEYKQFTK